MRYNSAARKWFKVRWGLYKKGLVQDHHVIPKVFKKHPTVVKSKFDIHASENIVMLPTQTGKAYLRVREDRLIHEGCHRAYNKYVENMLNHIQTDNDFQEFVKYLKISCRYKPHQIPWY